MALPNGWPYKANQHRTEAIRIAKRIADLADTGRRGTTNVNVTLADIRAAALEIALILTEAPDAKGESHDSA